jgi:Uma2 family endonuclease
MPDSLLNTFLDMSTQTQTSPETAIEYPDDDGLPMSDNTLQFEWIVTIKGGLDAVFRNNSDVFVAGNLLWYPVEGDPGTRSAPDALVVFGRPKGYRGSYKQWEEESVPPQVVFEVLSPGNRFAEMLRKFQFYERYGVEEYYLYDPDHNELTGWIRSSEQFVDIPALNGWVSPRLKTRFELTEHEFRIYGPDGQPFATYLELVEQREQERLEKEKAREDAAVQAQRAKRLIEQLRSLGVEPDI